MRTRAEAQAKGNSKMSYICIVGLSYTAVIVISVNEYADLF